MKEDIKTDDELLEILEGFRGMLSTVKLSIHLNIKESESEWPDDVKALYDYINEMINDINDAISKRNIHIIPELNKKAEVFDRMLKGIEKRKEDDKKNKKE